VCVCVCVCMDVQLCVSLLDDAECILISIMCVHWERLSNEDMPIHVTNLSHIKSRYLCHELVSSRDENLMSRTCLTSYSCHELVSSQVEILKSRTYTQVTNLSHFKSRYSSHELVSSKSRYSCHELVLHQVEILKSRTCLKSRYWWGGYDSQAPSKHRSLLQKSPIQEPIFCKRDL